MWSVYYIPLYACVCMCLSYFLCICITGGVPVQADLAKFKESVRFKDSPANRAVFSVKHR